MAQRTLDILAIGEAMVEFNQNRPEDPAAYIRGFGGDTSNAVIAAARQGVRSGYLTRVGQDEFGQALTALWSREGVDTSAVQVDEQARTGLYFVHHGEGGHRFTYLRAGSAASRMGPAHVRPEVIASARILHVSGISQAISASAREAVRHAIGLARQAGVTVSYDPNLRLALWSLEEARQEIVRTIALTDEFLPSLDDVVQVSGLSQPEDIVRWAHGLGARQVVLKLGARGALVSDGQRCELVPAVRVDAVDATGAGDCFDGSYLGRRAAGDDPWTAARWACAAAGLATTGYGAVAPLPTREQVQARLAAG